MTDLSLGGVVCGVDATADSLGSTEGLTAEPLEISHNGLGVGLGLDLSHLSGDISVLLSELNDALLRELTRVKLGPEVVSVGILLVLDLNGGGGGEKGGVE